MIEAQTVLARPDTTAQFGTSKNGKDECVIAFTILDGPNTGERISAYLYFSTDAGMARSIESMRYCGCTFPGEDITNLEGLGSRDVQLVIEQEDWDGKTRAKVKYINSGTPIVANPMGAGERQSFKDRMRGQLLSLKANAGASTVDDSKIPF